MRPALTEQELQRLEAAVRSAERGTTAEIVVVVAGDPAGGAAWAPWSGLIALALSLPLVVAQPSLSAPLLYSLQLTVVLIVLLATLLPRLRCRLVPARERASAAQRLARDQFFDLGLHRTSGRAGVLLFVSPHDRYVEVIADAGVPGPLPDQCGSHASTRCGPRPASDALQWESSVRWNCWVVSCASACRESRPTATSCPTGRSSSEPHGRCQADSSSESSTRLTVTLSSRSMTTRPAAMPLVVPSALRITNHW